MAESSFVTATKFLHPLTPKTDKDLISPYNTTPESNIKVTRLKENDQQLKKPLIDKEILPVSSFVNVYRKYGEYVAAARQSG